MYPQLVIDLTKLRHNVREVAGRCEESGIELCGVVKGFRADLRMVDCFIEGGARQIGTSRLSQIRRMKEAGIDLPFVLLRIAQHCEAADVAELADYSLQSELSVMEAIDEEAKKAGKPHNVIVMADLGDLREGYWDKEEMIEVCLRVERELRSLRLAGVGVNLGCYGSIRPTREKMLELLEIAREVEERIGRELEIVSGGATSSFVLVNDGQMPEGINHLRIGEGICPAYDLPYLWGIEDMNYLYTDVITLRAQVLEVKTKPSYPQGEFCINAFGDVPQYEDRGMRQRALLAIGGADAGDACKLLPRLSGAEIIGYSSDHSILDIEDCEEDINPGDVLDFDIRYPNMLALTGSPDLKRIYIDEEV